MSRKIWSAVPGTIVFIVLFGLWQLLVDLNNVSPLVIPAPTAIYTNVASHLGPYWHDARVTFLEALYGFAVALVTSIVLAAGMVHFRVIRQAVDPVAIALRCLPVVALAPALALWLGFGILPKVIVVALITFPPFLVNLTSGLQTVDESMLEVLESVYASRWEIFTKLRVPNALPFLFSATKVCTTLALIGAVVAEFSASSQGLGYRIIRAQNDLSTTTVWGAITVLAVMGIVLTLIVTVIERRSLRWLGTD